MDCGAEDVFHGFMSGLGECRMCMDGIDEIIDGTFQRHGGDGFRDHFRDRVSKHMNAENLPILLICDNLDESIRRVFDSGLGNRRKRKLTNLDLVSGLSGFGLIPSDTGHLGFAIGAPVCS